jgi:hypothetical protein
MNGSLIIHLKGPAAILSSDPAQTEGLRKSIFVDADGRKQRSVTRRYIILLTVKQHVLRIIIFQERTKRIESTEERLIVFLKKPILKTLYQFHRGYSVLSHGGYSLSGPNVW